MLECWGSAELCTALLVGCECVWWDWRGSWLGRVVLESDARLSPQREKAASYLLNPDNLFHLAVALGLDGRPWAGNIFPDSHRWAIMLGCNKIKTKREAILDTGKGLRPRSPDTSCVISGLWQATLPLWASVSPSVRQITFVTSSKVRTIGSAWMQDVGIYFLSG